MILVSAHYYLISACNAFCLVNGHPWTRIIYAVFNQKGHQKIIEGIQIYSKNSFNGDSSKLVFSSLNKLGPAQVDAISKAQK